MAKRIRKTRMDLESSVAPCEPLRTTVRGDIQSGHRTRGKVRPDKLPSLGRPRDAVPVSRLVWRVIHEGPRARDSLR